jgi:transcription antitermination factor NusG
MYVLTIIPPVFLRNYEFEVEADIAALGFDVTVPTRTVIMPRQGRTVQKRSPIYRGYAFAEFPLERWDDIKRVNGVRGLLRLGNRLARLTEDEVTAAKTLSEVEDSRSTPSRFARGQKVRIRRGAMATLNALISRIDGWEIVVDVEMFGRTFNGIRVPESDIEAVGNVRD